MTAMMIGTAAVTVIVTVSETATVIVMVTGANPAADLVSVEILEIPTVVQSVVEKEVEMILMRAMNAITVVPLNA